MSTSRSFAALAASLCLGSVACAERSSAPPPSSTSRAGPPSPVARTYDPATVESIRGRVIRVGRFTSPSGRSSGVHVTLETNREVVAVHLGPAWYVERQELQILPGDWIQVIGSRVTIDGAPAVIAQRVEEGDQVLVLRDDAGVPRWSQRGAGSEVSALNVAEERALRDALDDEYRAWATYDQVIRDFGPEPPFVDVRDAEARHIEALRSLFERYRLEIPENTWPGRVPRYASIEEACEAGAEGELETAALYERLLESTSRPNLVAVFTNLQRASQEDHLPAFRRCFTRATRR